MYLIVKLCENPSCKQEFRQRIASGNGRKYCCRKCATEMRKFKRRPAGAEGAREMEIISLSSNNPVTVTNAKVVTIEAAELERLRTERDDLVAKLAEETAVADIYAGEMKDRLLQIMDLTAKLEAIPALVERLLDDAGYIGRTYSPNSRHRFMRRLREELAAGQFVVGGDK